MKPADAGADERAEQRTAEQEADEHAPEAAGGDAARLRGGLQRLADAHLAVVALHGDGGVLDADERLLDVLALEAGDVLQDLGRAIGVAVREHDEFAHGYLPTAAPNSASRSGQRASVSGRTSKVMRTA
jgi:hypothetical protein